MKPEFSEILLPGHRVVAGPSVQNSNLKWLALIGTLFVVTVTGMIAFYEIRFARYDLRMSALEEEINNFNRRYDELKMESYYDNLEDDRYGNSEDEDDDLDDEEDIQLTYGELKLEDEDPRGRSKRQIPVPPTTVFDPNVPRTSDGVPILDNSYLDKIGVPTSGYVHWSNILPTQDSEGLRLYESLVATGGRGEPRSADYYPEPTASNSGILPHHRTSAAWVERPERGGIQLKSGDSSTGDSIYTRSGTGTGSRNSVTSQRGSTFRAASSSVDAQGKQSEGVTGGASSQFYSSSGSSGSSTNYLSGSRSGGNTVINRASRVPATGDFLYNQNTRTRSIQYPPLKRIGQGDGEVVARVLQASESETDSTRPATHTSAQANLGDTAGAQAESRRTYRGGRAQRRGQLHRRRYEPTKYQRKEYSDVANESDEVNIVKAEAWVEGQRATAAHYVADVSNFTTSHRHYEGNGRLRNADGIFSAWKPSEWMGGNEASKSAFSLSTTGVVTIRQTGLYYVYAQIHYIDDHDINSFTVNINSTPFLQCTTMTETYNGGSKSNTCFTAGVTLLKENDRIFIKDVEQNRYSIFKEEKSFFGLMKLNGDSGVPKV
ncbi:unnamed protein product [Allacma fusca]|uniref:THD domain-containing protein n=1 Tax=Allacma fusca TaxID=39272 RepID=A0A8J2JWY2_9HEXA|nr:unnamed protein product [Allacma fusca]